MAGLRQTKGISLPELRDRIAGLRDAAFRARLAQNLGEEARTQVANGFREERDPYGNAWDPLKYRTGKILQKSGRMRAAVAVQQTTNGFRADIPVKYAPPHQYGALVKAHRRAGGILVQDARGRFVSKAKLARQLKRGNARGISTRRFHAFDHGGGAIPRRQMLPEKDTGGLGPIWSAAFREVADDVIAKHMAGR